MCVYTYIGEQITWCLGRSLQVTFLLGLDIVGSVVPSLENSLRRQTEQLSSSLIFLENAFSVRSICLKVRPQTLESIRCSSLSHCLPQFSEQLRIMMCMQWQTPLFFCFLNVKCTCITIRAQSLQEWILRNCMKENMLRTFWPYDVDVVDIPSQAVIICLANQNIYYYYIY